MESWSFRDENDISDQSRHPGQMIGFDVFVEKNKILFSPGFHYHRISVLNEDNGFSFDFSNAHHLHYFNIPITFGYKVMDLPILETSILGGAEAQFFYDLDDNDIGLDDDQLYGVSMALTAILHMEWFTFLTAEIRYHHGLLPLIKTRDESKIRGVTLALGVKI
jgi:hypothetical protein